MGDRFYTQQKIHKPTRVLKADVIKQLQKALGREIGGLDRLTIKTLEELIEVIDIKEIHYDSF